MPVLGNLGFLPKAKEVRISCCVVHYKSPAGCEQSLSSGKCLWKPWNSPGYPLREYFSSPKQQHSGEECLWLSPSLREAAVNTAGAGDHRQLRIAEVWPPPLLKACFYRQNPVGAVQLCFRVSQQAVALEGWVCRAKLLVQSSQQSHRWRGVPLDWHQLWAVCREPLSTGEHQMPSLSSPFGTESPEGHCVSAVTSLVWTEAPVLAQHRQGCS